MQLACIVPVLACVEPLYVRKGLLHLQPSPMGGTALTARTSGSPWGDRCRAQRSEARILRGHHRVGSTTIPRSHRLIVLEPPVRCLVCPLTSHASFMTSPDDPWMSQSEGLIRDDQEGSQAYYAVHTHSQAHCMGMVSHCSASGPTACALLVLALLQAQDTHPVVRA